MSDHSLPTSQDLTQSEYTPERSQGYGSPLAPECDSHATTTAISTQRWQQPLSPLPMVYRDASSSHPTSSLTPMERQLLHGARSPQASSTRGHTWDLFDDTVLQMDAPTSPAGIGLSTWYTEDTPSVVNPTPSGSHPTRKPHQSLPKSVLDKYGGAIASRSRRIANIVTSSRHSNGAHKHGLSSHDDGSAALAKTPRRNWSFSRDTALTTNTNSDVAEIGTLRDDPSSSWSTRATLADHSTHRVRSKSLPMFGSKADGDQGDAPHAAHGYELVDLHSAQNPKDGITTSTAGDALGPGKPTEGSWARWRPSLGCIFNTETPGIWSGSYKRVRGWVSGFVYPDGINRFGRRNKDRVAFMTKIGFVITLAIATALFTLWATLVPKALCSTNYTFTAEEVKNRRFVSANGVVSNFNLVHSSLARDMSRFAGYDVSTLFPAYAMLMMGDIGSAEDGTKNEKYPEFATCQVNMTAASIWADAWIKSNPMYKKSDGRLAECPLPLDPQQYSVPCLSSQWNSFLGNQVGWVQLNKTAVESRHATPETGWVILNDYVYDVSDYLRFATQLVTVEDSDNKTTTKRETRNDTMFLPAWLTEMVLEGVGTDISDQFNDMSLERQACWVVLDTLFFRGTTQKTRTKFACANTNIVAWLTFGLYFFSVFIRILFAEYYIWWRSRKTLRISRNPSAHVDTATAAAASGGSDTCDEPVGTVPAGPEKPGPPLCAVFIPCFDESYDELNMCLQSIACSAYPDDKTLLIVVTDGVPETLKHLLQITANPSLGCDPKMYAVYGHESANTSSYGLARVYSGHYECRSNRLPYIIIEKEQFHGHVDSLMLALNILRSFSSAKRDEISALPCSRKDFTTPAHSKYSPQRLFLDEELESHLVELKCPPGDIRYCLFTEPTMQIESQALCNLIQRMESDERVLALSGTLLALNPKRSVLRAIETYSMYLDHSVWPAWCALTGDVPVLHQTFTMYRAHDKDGQQRLGTPEFLSLMNSDMTPSLGNKHAHCSGIDGILIPKVCQHYTVRSWGFEPTARAGIVLPDTDVARFDSRTRQLFRAGTYILLNSLSLQRIWRWEMLLMLVHLLFPFVSPAATVMLYLELIIACFRNTPAIVVTEIIAAIVGAMVILFLLLRRWSTPLYMLVFAVLGIPVYFIWVPISSYITMDRLWVPPTRLQAAQKNNALRFGEALDVRRRAESSLHEARPFDVHHKASKSLNSESQGSSPAVNGPA